MSVSSDATLVAQTLDGDATAFGSLVDKYKTTVLAVAYAYTGNFHDAEDVAQECFLRAYTKLGQLRDATKFSSWLYKIANTCCQRWYKRQSRRSEVIQPWDDHAEQAIAQNAQRSHVEEETHRALWDAIQRLPEKQRTTLLLFYQDELSCEEIAGFFGVSTNTIKSWLHRVRKKLRAELGATDLEERLIIPPPGVGFTSSVMEAVQRLRRPVTNSPKVPWIRLLPIPFLGLLFFALLWWMRPPSPRTSPGESILDIFPGADAFLFEGVDGARNTEILLMSLRDGRVENLTHHPARDWGARWNQETREIFFFSDRDEGAATYAMDIKGENLRKILDLPPSARWWARWSADGKQIAFSAVSPENRHRQWGNLDLFVSSTDGTVRRLTHQRGSEENPDWSPDGRWLVYTSEDQSWNDFKAIYLISADGERKVKLSQEVQVPLATSYSTPVWSPDGKRIAFCRQEARFTNGMSELHNIKRDLWIISPDGSDPVNLTHTADEDAFNPTFLSRRHIAFQSIPPLEGKNEWRWDKARWLVVDVKTGQQWEFFPKGALTALGGFTPYRCFGMIDASAANIASLGK